MTSTKPTIQVDNPTSELAQGVGYYRESGGLHEVRNAGIGFLNFVEVEILTPLQGPEKKA